MRWRGGEKERVGGIKGKKGGTVKMEGKKGREREREGEGEKERERG